MMIPRLRKPAALTMIMVAVSLYAPMLALAQSAGFNITPIVKRGDPVGDGGRFFDCDDCEGRVVGLHAFNDKGEVTIGADTSGTCFEGRFLISGGLTIRLADFCQQTPWGKFGILSSVNLNQRSQAAMLVAVPVDGRLDAALFLYSDGQMTKIVQEFDTSPVGGMFKGCGFGQPTINNNGEVAFFACGEKDGFFFGDGVFRYSNGLISKVVVSDDPSPIGGTFLLNFIPAQAVQMNDSGDVLFRAGLNLGPTVKEKLGLFLATKDGVKAIEVDGDAMPLGGKVIPDTFGFGDLNNRRDVVFAVGLTGGQTDSGIFLYSADHISKIMLQGDPTPIGGRFGTLSDNSFTLPRVNVSGSVAFKVSVAEGSAPSAIFLASPSAMVKVVAVGDLLPTGETIRVIDTFALNDLGQVAFFAYGKKDKTKPLGVYLATPPAPAITSIRLKSKKGSLQLRVNGNAMITSDTVIEINGVVLTAIDYPSDFQEDGGFTTRVVSRDARLEQLIPEGQTVQMTVFNSLTNLRSAPVMFTR